MTEVNEKTMRRFSAYVSKFCLDEEITPVDLMLLCSSVAQQIFTELLTAAPEEYAQNEVDQLMMQAMVRGKIKEVLGDDA